MTRKKKPQPEDELDPIKAALGGAEEARRAGGRGAAEPGRTGGGDGGNGLRFTGTASGLHLF